MRIRVNDGEGRDDKWAWQMLTERVPDDAKGMRFRIDDLPYDRSLSIRDAIQLHGALGAAIDYAASENTKEAAR